MECAGLLRPVRRIAKSEPTIALARRRMKEEGCSVFRNRDRAEELCRAKMHGAIQFNMLKVQPRGIGLSSRRPHRTGHSRDQDFRAYANPEMQSLR
jgi:hypothetical protein